MTYDSGTPFVNNQFKIIDKKEIMIRIDLFFNEIINYYCLAGLVSFVHHATSFML